MSSAADPLCSGSDPDLPDFCAEGTSPLDFGLVGSPDMNTR
jgi:hypothetical protein